tara:strand:- start:146 stop:556 length:411 start_codon:yes stop_codon:yes gene_type:complete
MIYSVKILKPDKNGKLVQIKNISDSQASEIHWSTFNQDFNRTKMRGTTGVKYHRIGATLKKCVEEDCKESVRDARCLTCSPKCKLKREDRQRMLSRIKEGNSLIVCKNCKIKFRARKDKKYCTNACRYAQKKGIHI